MKNLENIYLLIQLLLIAIKQTFCYTPYLKSITTKQPLSSHASNNNQQQQPPSTNDNNIENNKSLLGPPTILNNLKVNESLRAHRTPSTTNKRIEFTITRVGHDPDIFILRNYVTIEECNTIIQTCDNSNDMMKQAETVSNENISTSRKNCLVSWLPPNPDEYPIVQSLMYDTANIFLKEDIKMHEDTCIEDLQVLKYDIDGEFVLHHDGEPRVLTVIYYLNGVAGTWFPLTRTGEDSQNDDPIIKNNINVNQIESEFYDVRNKSKLNLNKDPQNKDDAMKLTIGNNFIPGVDGLLLKSSSSSSNDDNHKNVIEINQGDAVAFYSYKTDGSGRINWRAIHSGTPTPDVKWIANHWFRRGPTTF